MATLGNKLITKNMQRLANMTELNHLGMALHARPERLMGVMDKLFSAQNYYSDNPLSSMLMGNSMTEKKIGSTEWEWELKGANEKPVVIMELLEVDNPTPGKFGTTFKIMVDENIYLPGDNISPGTSGNKYLSRIQDSPTREGNGFVLTLKLVGKNSDFIPPALLAPGKKWGKFFSTYEEGAEQSGSTQFTTSIGLKNRLGKLRKEYRITDYASTEVLAVKIADSNGKEHDSWMRFADVEYWIQWYREIERALWYNRSAEGIVGSTGRPVRGFPGIQEQLEDSHIGRTSILTAKYIEEYLMDIFYGRVKPGKGRNIKGWTGEYGLLNFHRAVTDWMDKTGFIKNVEIFTNKVGSPVHSNAFETGFQMVKYHMANGSSLELIHNPLNDDKNIHFEIDEITGFPLESQRITFLDFTGDSGSNIQLIKKIGGDYFNYVMGNYGPTGPNTSQYVAHSGDYYEMHVGTNIGVHIGDVTKCGEILTSRN
jgi:hypothetical protein